MKNLKTKVIALLLAFVMVFSLAACGGNSTKKDADKKEGEAKVTGTYEGSAKGYAGDVVAKLTLKDGKIEKIEVKAEKETPTIGGAAIEKLVANIISAQSTQIDGISGATLSSNGLKEAVDKALTAAGIDPKSLVAKTAEVAKEDKTVEAEVVVIGAGGAGMTSAINLAEKGVKVLVLEKAATAGGNTSRATGGINAAETHYQKEQKIDDSVEVFIKDTMKGGHDKNDPELVKILAQNSAKAIDWLDTIDAKMPSIKFAGGATNMRSHRPLNAEGKVIPVGTFLVEKLMNKVKDLGIEVMYNAQVKEVLMKDGKVSGVVAETEGGKITVNAKAVVVATGGFGGNPQLIESLRPDLKGYVSTNAPSITGDAVEFLKSVNAQFIDMDQIQIHPTVIQKDGYLISESLRGDGAILLNKAGKRFINELLTRDVVSAGINKEEGSFAWLLVDQKMFDASKVVQGYVEKAYMEKAEDQAALAKLLGVDEAVIKETLSKWTAAVKAQKDEEFGREGLNDTEYDLAEGPYYVAKISPGIHHTMGGVKINTNAEVLDKDNKVIPGLYAAGEVTGGVHGGNRLGGNAVTDVVVFGRLSAESVLKYLGK